MANTTTGNPLNLFTPVEDEILNTNSYLQNMNKINDFAKTKGQAEGLATLDINKKLAQMPTIKDIGAAPDNVVPVGTVFIYFGDKVQTGCIFAKGQAVSRTTYKELFDIYGTTFGKGDGTTTFNLPDLRKRVPVGCDDSDNDFKSVGKTGGTKEVELRALIGAYDGAYGKIGYRPTEKVWSPMGIIGGGISDAYVGDASQVNHSTLVVQQNGNKPTTLQPYITVNYMIRY